MIYIGIDPGVKTGYAVYSAVDGLMQCETIKIHNALVRVQNWGHLVTVVMEDARLRRKFMFGPEVSQGAGSIKRDCSIWEDFCEDNNIPLITVAPQNTRTKYSVEAFQKITGFTKRTSNHARDAAMLVWGRK